MSVAVEKSSSQTMPKLPPVHRYVSNSGVRIYRIPCNVLPDLTGRVHLLLGAGPPTLVDTGSGEGESPGHLLDGLETVRTRFAEPIRLADVKRILITHAHRDHFGGLPELAARTGAEVAVHPLDRRVIEANDERAAVHGAAFRRFLDAAGVPCQRRQQLLEAFRLTAGRVRSVPVDFTLDDGKVFDGLKILHTPGHSPGHVSIIVGDVILVGDHILARTLTQQWPESVAAYAGLGHYLDSLEKVRQAGDFTMALGGHELPVRDIPRRIDEIRISQERRLERMLDILRGAGRPLSIAEVSEKMYSHQEGFRAMLAITDVGSRVEYLDQRGELAVANLDEVERTDTPVYRYQPVDR
jgi:glyoxylase-like metal-dependent hydrolase (beta-lactamase superfamily II)